MTTEEQQLLDKKFDLVKDLLYYLSYYLNKEDYKLDRYGSLLKQNKNGVWRVAHDEIYELAKQITI